jgi:hypothetical protein
MGKMTLPRKCNTYLDTIPVTSERKLAEVFSREISWDIWQVLREAGARGMTAKDVVRAFRTTPENVKQEGYKYPVSTIYQALDTLEKMGCVESTTRAVSAWGHPSREEKERRSRVGAHGGRPQKVYTAAILNNPGDPVAGDFLDKLWPVLEKHVPEIKERWIELLEKIMNEFNDAELKNFLPEDEIHEMCGLNHEGYEFIRAVSYGILQFIEDEVKEWEEFARKHRIVK